MSSKKVLVLLIENFEECEVIIPVDVLRRAGLKVTMASVLNEQNSVRGCQNVKILPDDELRNLTDEFFDCVIIPGGPGADKISKNAIACEVIKKHFDNNKLIAAICKGTLVLLSNKIGFGRRLTSYHKFRDELKNYYDYKDEKVVRDYNLITSQCPGTAFDFALEIANYLEGPSLTDDLKHHLNIS